MQLEFNQDIAKKLMDQQFWNALALDVIRTIKQRTRKSIDVDGQPFREYTKAHLRKRQQAGIVPAGQVTLQFSRNGMLKALDHMVANDLHSVTLYFNNSRAQQLALYHNDMGAGKGKVIRRFFGLSQEEEKRKVEKYAYNYLHKMFSKL